METTVPRDTLLRRSAFIGLVLAAIGAVALMSAPAARAASPLSTRISIDDDGFEATIKRPSYRLDLELDGVATYTADESDLATLSAGGELEIEEKVDGEQHRYTVEADRSGKLTREYARGGTTMPIDAAGRAWLAAALQRAFRTAGLDAEARAARLLARGPDVLLGEVARIESDWVRSTYLRIAFVSPTLDAAAAARAFQLARGIGSDFELVELLIAAAPRLPAEVSTVTAWRTAVTAVQSDFEMRRALVAVAPQVAPGTDSHKRYVAIARGMGDFERGEALTALVDARAL
jgi:hypothetical protein